MASRSPRCGHDRGAQRAGDVAGRVDDADQLDTVQAGQVHVVAEAISTLRLSRWVRRRASFAVVVVLPEPCRPTIMMATGGTALRSIVWPSAPSVSISWSWTILTTIWPGVTDLTRATPDRLLADPLGEGADHVERDVRLEQRAAHLAHRGVDVGFRQRTASGQSIEDSAKRFYILSNNAVFLLPSP